MVSTGTVTAAGNDASATTRSAWRRMARASANTAATPIAHTARLTQPLRVTQCSGLA